MSNADIGHGAKIEIEDEGGGGTFGSIGAEVTRIKPSGWSRDEEDATHLESPGGIKEFIAALAEQTPCEFDVNWVPKENDPLLAAFNRRNVKWQITAPNGVRMQFPGFVTTYEPGEFTSGKMTATVTIRPTGKATLLAPAAT